MGSEELGRTSDPDLKHDLGADWAESGASGRPRQYPQMDYIWREGPQIRALAHHTGEV